MTVASFCMKSLLSIINILFLYIGAISLWGQNYNFVPVFIDQVNCDSGKTALLDCDYAGSGRNCRNGGGASVRCSEERLRVKNVGAVTVNTTTHTQTVTISWELYSGALHKPNSFRVWCFNQYVEFSCG